jgi:dipeptidyl aminopeptidase/acylaminoacyl peptidase
MPILERPARWASDAADAPRRAQRLLLPWGLLVTSAWLVAGIYLDGWAHNHGKVDESFFTPWHAVLYSGYLVSAAVVLGALTSRIDRRVGLPSGYWMSLVGVAVFALGGLGDMLWHIAFGIEADVAALLSPTHLVLALGASLIIAGPLRAACLRADDQARRLVEWMPAIVSLTLLYAVLTFMTQFAHPQVWPQAGSDHAHVSVTSDVYAMDSNGGGQTRLIHASGSNVAQAAWSADGRHLAFATWRAADRMGSLVVSDTSGLDQRVLTSGADRAAPSFPAWSPDARSIAVIAARDGHPDVWLIGADGTNDRRLTRDGVVPGPLAWSSDGARLAFTAEHDGAPWVHVVDVRGGSPTPLTEGVGPSWSPDGSRIAFGWGRSGTGEIYTIASDGTDLRRLTATSSSVLRRAWSWWPAWAPDGSRIAFQSNRGGTIDVFVTNADGTNPRNLTDNASLDSFQPAWSPDGQHLIFTARGHTEDPDLSQAFGVASILLQAGLLIGVVLLTARRWRLPPGTCTVLFTASAMLTAFLNDTFHFIPAAAAPGLVADALLYWHGTRRPRLVAFAIPAIFYAGYFVALGIVDGLGWTIHLWAGSIVLAGIVGWLLSYLDLPPTRAKHSAA